MRVTPALVMIAALLLYSCGGGGGYGKTEESWNGWIGTTKDDRVRDLGIPTRCHSFKTGGEACEWPMIWGPNLSGTLTMTFDPQGRACQWVYKDIYTDRRSSQQCQ